MAYYHSKYGAGYKRKKRAKLNRLIFLILFIFILISGFAAYKLYQAIFDPNTWTADQKAEIITVPTGSNYDDLRKILYKNGLVVNRQSFEWLAERKKLPQSIKSGMYSVPHGMNNNDLINKLRAGLQTPTKLIFHNINTKEELAGSLSRQIEADSLSIIRMLNDSLYQASLGLDTATAVCLFIPNTYEFFWNTSAKQLFNRMESEYNKFWNKNRMALADSIGMSPSEVMTLASIVEKETNKNDEKARIAGVYLNRLKSGWRLQADPTLKFAMRNFGLRRILTAHLEYDSPYNTYLHTGIPPGPICLPSIKSIDAVLNAEKHNYFFFCAKADLSGYHEFSKTSAEHGANARKYHDALNRNRIYR